MPVHKPLPKPTKLLAELGFVSFGSAVLWEFVNSRIDRVPPGVATGAGFVG